MRALSVLPKCPYICAWRAAQSRDFAITLGRSIPWQPPTLAVRQWIPNVG
jgi:hypothetical protein